MEKAVLGGPVNRVVKYFFKRFTLEVLVGFSNLILIQVIIIIILINLINFAHILDFIYYLFVLGVDLVKKCLKCKK